MHVFSWLNIIPIPIRPNYSKLPSSCMQLIFELHDPGHWHVGPTESDLKPSSCSQDTLPSGFGTHKHPRAKDDVGMLTCRVGGLLVANS